MSAITRDGLPARPTVAITAIPCGRDADGQPLARRRFDVVRPPEEFDSSRGYAIMRLWGDRSDRRLDGYRDAPLALVYADSIEPA